ncbi:HEAT repeat-containing protein [Cardiosporidium cionae]|uniref:HEAT repeat-containing protein n=1 Tax=Cardiosporidium cionae TaxID=476202 RepID=A0ABQ7J6W8_9APIC|nr:HEAT repeat-containing protein [Cardiosporidium cionae]|eukprot:KAF8819732.1 HEAT repeat-containing protein [Cardiosporidium cionae]
MVVLSTLAGGYFTFFILATSWRAHSNYSSNVQSILSKIILPNCIWRPGEANATVRKAALLCLERLLNALSKQKAIEETGLSAGTDYNSDFDCCKMCHNVVAAIKGAINDDWAPGNREMACYVTSALLDCKQTNYFSNVDLTSFIDELSPELFKRLDDAEDDVRVAACNTISKMCSALPQAYRNNTKSIALAVKSLSVHANDSNLAVSEAAANALKSVAESNALV